MKGKLINEDNKWFVQYKTGKFEGEYLYGQLPLHPDTFKGITEENQGEYFVKYSGILGNISIKDYADVEFEIVKEFKENKLWGQKGTGVYTKYAKLITTKQGSFDEDGFAVTRVIDDKQETTTSWDEIYENFKKEWQDDVDLLHWLKENYHPPIKK